jgi:hypothetical protein
MLPEVRNLLSELEKYKEAPKTYGVGPGEYYDDLCLARFLEGVCLRYVAYPVSLVCIFPFRGEVFMAWFGFGVGSGCGA